MLGLVAPPEQLEVIARIQAMMSVLEGHGDVTMDRAGAEAVPDAAWFSRVLRERRDPGARARCGCCSSWSASRPRCASTSRGRVSSGPWRRAAARGSWPGCGRAPTGCPPWRRSATPTTGWPGPARLDSPSADGCRAPAGPGELLGRCSRHLPTAGTPLVCAVSGGPDSLALLVLACAAGAASPPSTSTTACGPDSGPRPRWWPPPPAVRGRVPGRAVRSPRPAPISRPGPVPPGGSPWAPRRPPATPWTTRPRPSCSICCGGGARRPGRDAARPAPPPARTPPGRDAALCDGAGPRPGPRSVQRRSPLPAQPGPPRASPSVLRRGRARRRAGAGPPGGTAGGRGRPARGAGRRHRPVRRRRPAPPPPVRWPAGPPAGGCGRPCPTPRPRRRGAGARRGPGEAGPPTWPPGVRVRRSRGTRWRGPVDPRGDSSVGAQWPRDSAMGTPAQR